MFVIKHKKIFFILSAVLVVLSIVAVIVWGLSPSVEFTGGSLVEVSYSEERPSLDDVRTAVIDAGFDDALVREAGEHSISVRTHALSEGEQSALLDALALGDAPTLSIERSSSIGPTIGAELRRKTYLAIALVVAMIILYVAFVFRKVSRPVSSWVYGGVAVIALLHDVIIPTGAFALLGYTLGFEADTLFVVALLTILGLSVNDTIVVFDRIRENLRRNEELRVKESFGETVGKSLQQTYVRSFNTSLTIILVLLTLLFLGGSAIHTFILTLLVGLIAGTYSSIFLASPLLVLFAPKEK